MGRTHAWLLGTAAAAFIASAGSAQAYTINDTTLVWGYNASSNNPENTGSTYGKWIDQLPTGDNRTPGFKTDGVNVSYGAGSVILDLYTNWRVGSNVSGATAGDIWLDLDQNASFESGIAFDRPGGNTSPVVANAVGVGFYKGTGGSPVTWATALDVWNSNSIIGGKYCTDCTAGATSPAPGTKPDTLSVITGGGTVAGLVTAQDSNFGSGSVQGIRITLSGLTDAELAEFQDGFTFAWGTGTCGNDTIVGTVPAVPVPAALPLMLTALGGLGVIARRRTAETA